MSHAGHTFQCEYYTPLVVLSYTISVLGAYCALQWASQIRLSRGWPQRGWVLGAAIAMGGGAIWSMHFIAMIACRLPLPVAYDVMLTLASLLVAVVMTGIGLYAVGVAVPSHARLVGSGVVTGLGVAAMHYTGMAGMRLAAVQVYDPLLVTASVVIAIVAATAALWIAFNTRRGMLRVASSLIMGVAVCGMHYTGMAAVTFVAIDAPVTLEGTAIKSDQLGFVVFGVTLFVLGLLSVSSEATERRRHQEVLRRAHEDLERQVVERTADLERQRAFLRQVIDATPNLIFAKDRDGRFTLVNRAVAEVYGTTVEELVGKTDADFNPNADEVASFLAADRDVMDSLREKVIPEEKVTDAAGNVKWLATIKRPIVGNDGKALMLGVSTDITARKILEEQFHQSQKMEAVGTLAGGVAHDFNNLLMVVLGYSDGLLRSLPDDDPTRAKIEKIHSAGQRAAALTHQLLAFSRKQTIRPAVIDLNTLVAGIESMLRRLLGEHIDVVTVPDPALGRINADSGQIEQILVNLLVNARDAMPQGGRILLETRNVDLDEAFVRAHVGAQHGPHVRLSVEDTGTGMDAATRSRIFEPFFTTKEPGKGTGLGLATVYGIVKQNNGYIQVESEPGRGARFEVYLPRVDQPAEAPAPAILPAAGGSETVLLVEDEAPVRELIRDILTDASYRVLDARHPGEALEICGRYQGPIQLLVTDVVMPQESGPDLARRLTAMRPEMKVLFISGYTSDALGAHGVVETGITLLEKPFTPAELTRKAREVLDAPHAPRLTKA